MSPGDPTADGRRLGVLGGASLGGPQLEYAERVPRGFSGGPMECLRAGRCSMLVHMTGVDALLDLAVQRGADELRLGSDRPPEARLRGQPVELSLPPMGDRGLRRLLAGLLDTGRDAALARGEPLRFEHQLRPGVSFNVALVVRGGARGPIEATFLRCGSEPAATVADDGASATAARLAAAEGPTSTVVMATPRPAAPAPTSRARHGEESIAVGLARLLARALAARASDVHLLDGTLPAIRVDGALRVLGDEAPCDVRDLLNAQLSEVDWARVEAGRSVDLPLHDDGLGSFRVNVFRACDGVAAAIRVLPHDPPPLSELGLPAPLDDLIEQPHGLVIVCGPTGSGKSTTLAALANEIVRRRPTLLVTLEDPIEYLLGRDARGLVRQRQIGRDAVDYPSGLRDALREDPDVLLIGEMRDPESISLALTAAETGHLVLTSLHSRSAASAIERIADVYAPERQRPLRAQLGDSLRAVVSQRLLPRADGPGRVVALEVMRVTHGVAALIREGNTAQVATAMQAGRREGMLPLERCLADLVRSARVTRATAAAFANDATALAQYLDSKG